MTISFSGAAPVKVRKAAGAWIYGANPYMLQWGRTREGAEGCLRGVVTTSARVASVGPHP